MILQSNIYDNYDKIIISINQTDVPTMNSEVMVWTISLSTNSSHV